VSGSRLRFDVNVATASSTARIEAELLASVYRDDDANVFVSRVPVLDVYSQGATAQEALRAVEHAVRLYFVAAYNRGVLRQMLGGREFVAPQYVRIVDDWRVPTRPLVATTITSPAAAR
jgi:predicted RNase H-like HicB family nuclease